MRASFHPPAYLALRPALLSWLALALLSVIVAPVLLRGVQRTDALLQYPYADDPLEGTLIHEARLLQQDQPLYQPIVPERFVSAPYTPLHPILLSWLDLTGPEALQRGRVLSLLPMLAVGLLVGLYLALHTRLPALGLLALLIWLCLPPVQLWATRVKPDGLALALSCLTLLVGGLRGGRLAAWAGLIGAMAFLAKQTAVAAPAALLLALLLTRRRRAVEFGLVYGSAVGAFVLALQVVSDGWALRHILGLHPPEWWSANLMYKYIALLVQVLPLPVLCLLGLMTGRGGLPMQLAIIYATGAPLLLYGAGEVGAHHNHLLEPKLAWLLAGGMGTGQLLTAPGRAGWAGALISLALLLATGQQLRNPPAWYGNEWVVRDQQRYVALIASTPGEILTDDVGLLVAADRPIRYNDPSTMGPAAASGIWSEAQLHREIAERRFQIVLLPLNLEVDRSDPAQRWSDATLALIHEHYQLLYRDTLFTYVPRHNLAQ